MDSLIFELQIVFYFQLFLSANVRHTCILEGEPIVLNSCEKETTAYLCKIALINKNTMFQRT